MEECVDIWSHVARQLILVCIGDLSIMASEDGRQMWHLTPLIRLYTRFPLFNGVLSSLVALETANTSGSYRRPSTSFPEFVIRHQLKWNHHELLISRNAISTYAVVEDDVDVTARLFAHVSLVGTGIIAAINTRSWDVIEFTTRDHRGAKMLLPANITPEGRRIAVAVGDDNHCLSLMAGLTPDVDVSFDGKRFDQLDYDQRTKVLQGWLVANAFRFADILNTRWIMECRNIHTAVLNAIARGDHANALGECIIRGFIAPNLEIFLMGGYDILLLGMELGWVSADQAVKRITDIFEDVVEQISNISLVEFLETTDEVCVFSADHYEIIAAAVMQIDENSCDLNNAESLLWLMSRNKLDRRFVQIATKLVNDRDARMILTGSVVPR